jgi:hypothetical protein
VVLMIVILTGVRWNLDMVLIYILFMARDGEYFFFFWPFILSSFEKVLYSFLTHCFIELLILWEFSFLSSL